MPQSREDVLRFSSFTHKITSHWAEASSHVKVVISYLYTIPWQKSLSKCQAWRCLWRKIFIVCQPIRTIFSILVQWIYNFHFPFQRKTFFYAMRDRLWLVPYDATDISTFSSDFCQGIVWRYDITIPWLVKMAKNLTFTNLYHYLPKEKTNKKSK